MIFTRRKTISEKINIKIDNQNISETKSSKFLWVYIDNSLNWKKHIYYIAGKISREIGIFLKSRKCLNKEFLLTLYYCFIYPFLIYCNHVWGTTYKTNLSKLQILQNQVLRIITGSKPRCHVDPLYKNLGVLNLSEINMYLTGACIKYIIKMFHVYLMISLCIIMMLAWTICWANSLLSGDLRCRDAHLTSLWYKAVTYSSLISNPFK